MGGCKKWAEVICTKKEDIKNRGGIFTPVAPTETYGDDTCSGPRAIT